MAEFNLLLSIIGAALLSRDVLQLDCLAIFKRLKRIHRDFVNVWCTSVLIDLYHCDSWVSVRPHRFCRGSVSHHDKSFGEGDVSGGPTLPTEMWPRRWKYVICQIACVLVFGIKKTLFAFCPVTIVFDFIRGIADFLRAICITHSGRSPLSKSRWMACPVSGGTGRYLFMSA